MAPLLHRAEFQGRREGGGEEVCAEEMGFGAEVDWKGRGKSVGKRRGEESGRRERGGLRLGFGVGG